MIHQPFHQRIQLNRQRIGEYNQAVNSTAGVARWYPLYLLLQQSFRGPEGKRIGFSDWQVARFIELRDEYEQGMNRKG